MTFLDTGGSAGQREKSRAIKRFRRESSSGTAFARKAPKESTPLAERRFSTRKRRRYLIEWQGEASLCTGFTHDVSPTGIFVRSTFIAKIGAILTMQLLLPGGGKLRLRGIVVRSHRIPQQLRGVVPSGFGVRLKEAPEEYFRLLADLFGVRFAS